MHSTYRASGWVGRDNLVAVWDDMPSEYVSEVFYSHVDVPEELESAVDADMYRDQFRVD